MSKNGVVMGFDFGTRKIGVAVGQYITGTASPLTILRARDGIPDWQQVAALLKEWEPVLLVVGLPLNMDGTASEMSRLSEKFSRKLNGRFNIPSLTVDERLSSFEATGMSDQEGPIDAIAAQLILETYFREAQ